MTLVDAPPPRRRVLVRLFLGALCAVMASMWVYYFFFASEQGVYQLQDERWRLAAAPICEAAQAERADLADTSDGYIRNPTVEQMRQRADIVDRATDIVERMLDDIVAIPVDNDRDRLLLETFDEHYRMVLADRRRYSASLRDGQLVPYTETVVGGGPVSNVVLDFTAGVKGNDVPLCSPPGELGGDIQP